MLKRATANLEDGLTNSTMTNSTTENASGTSGQHATGKRLRSRPYHHLTFWVLLAVVTGVLIGAAAPASFVDRLKPLADIFVEALKYFVGPLIFLTVTLGIASMGDLKRVGKIGGKALIYFEVVTTLALIIGIAVAHLYRAGEGVMPPSAEQMEKARSRIEGFQLRAEDFSWFHFLKGNVPLQVLLASIVAGSVLTMLPQKMKDQCIGFLTAISPYMFRLLHLLMWFAPLAAMAGMAMTVSQFGIQALWPLAKLMLSVYTTMALFIFIVLGGLMRYYKISLWRFLGYIKAELLIVLGASSSEAALPALMEKLERMGCAKPIVGLVVPAGYSFNLDGTTIYLSMATIFLAQVYHIPLHWWQLLTIIGVLMLTSKGAAGVTGMGFVVLVSTLSAVKVIPVEGLVLLLGVDRFMSEARAITNFIGNGVATVILANHEKSFDRTMMEAEFATGGSSQQAS